MRFLKSVLLSLSLLACFGQPAMSGGLVCTVVDSIWRAGHSSAETTLNAEIDAMVTTFAANSTLTTNMVISAIRVLTKETSVGAEVESVGVQQSMKAASETYVEQRMAEELVEAHNTYGPPGQAVGACDVVRDLAVMNTALDSVESRASEIVMAGGIDVRPGSTVTADEAIAKRAAVGAADFNQAVSVVAFLDPDTPAAFKDTFMNNVIGVPLDKPASLDGVEDGIQFMRARQAEALRSPAVTSLASVRAAFEEAGHFEVDTIAGGVTRSLNETIDWLVDRYGGGEEYTEWSAELVTKSDVGLMKELAVLRSISLTIARERNQSADRQQAVLAALLATEVTE